MSKVFSFSQRLFQLFLVAKALKCLWMEPGLAGEMKLFTCRRVEIM